MLAGCHYGWQGAKFGKSPRPKHRAIARCEVCLSMYITYISVSMPTPWAVAGPNGQLASILWSTDPDKDFSVMSEKKKEKKVACLILSGEKYFGTMSEEKKKKR